MADRYQQAVYQLKPESAEVRALPLEPCRPLSVAFDPTANILYIICLENSLYHIQKKTFDGRIDKTLYRVPQGRRARRFSTTFRTDHVSVIAVMSSRFCLKCNAMHS